MYDTCQLKFRFAYVDKRDIPSEQTVSLALGNTCHRTLEYLYKQTSKGYTLSLDTILAYAKTQRTKETAPLPDACDEDWARVVKHITRYYQTYAPFTHDTTIGTEVRFSLPLDNGYTFTGVIDRVALHHRTLKLIDYKTSQSIKTTADNEYTHQLKTYALAAHHLYP
jgi:RecB family exonuclease